MKASDLTITIYADGADIEAMKEEYRKGYVKGFTTNPTLMKKAGVTDYVTFAKECVLTESAYYPGLFFHSFKIIGKDFK